MGSAAISISIQREAIPFRTCNIREATLDDIDHILTLHCEAFADKFGGAFGAKRVAKGATAMAAVWQYQGSTSLQGMFVAEHEGQVIGTTMLRTYEMGKDQTGSVDRVFQQVLGTWGATRSIFALSLLHHHIGRGEGFITDVAVLKPYRRNGVAKILLTHAEVKAKQLQKTYLGLYVSSTNLGARKLYESLNFRQIHVRRSWLTRWIYGQREWIYMRKNLL